jgi:superfamily II DNA or RNA helicase
MKQEQIQNKILKFVPDNPHGRYILAPRFGKTIFVLKILKKLNNTNLSILWVTPFSKLKDQIITEFNSFNYPIDNLKISTWASLSKQEAHYDIIILDEEQFITSKNSENLINGKLKYSSIISMTGTSPKKRDKLELFDKLNLKIIYQYNIEKAVSDKVLNDYEIKVVNIPYDYKNHYINTLEKALKPLGQYSFENNKIVFTGNLNGFMVTSELSKSKKGNLLYKIFNKHGQSVGYLLEDTLIGKATIQGTEYYLKEGNYYNSNVNVLSLYNQIKEYKQKYFAVKTILDIVKGQTIVFCSSINQAESLCKHTYHSKSDDTNFNKFLSGEINTLGLVNIGSVGSNFKGLNNLLLVQCNSDNNGTSSQKITRILLKEKNKKPVIWLFCLLGTQDEKWVKATLSSFDNSKIKYINI